ncbi:glycosyltransferase [Blastopirellula sp. JC732]|uniref:Glycosyltransferase n=1 Tax=Blastopirellula sediminis TaxID=2894196 RepID=A0A9X1MHF6_9BACT|nr:glycosyltransferase [Blastopirellula sediminis]MCC9608049.1 glycosyltransferase [Blastopirellula sediminis]MCC9627158.1 glycosyltransferase [Blastopirellula sediminis]
MKVLLCHGYYTQRGGEDLSFEDEARILARSGHTVLQYTIDNKEAERMGKLSLARNMLWNKRTYRDVQNIVRSERPDVVHCTNTFPLMSPSVYYACRETKTPIVQSLRNYRLLCPAFNFLRDGKVCEACLQKSFAWPAVRYGCYRNSRSASAMVAATYGLHRLLGTWSARIDMYFTLTQFARQKFIDGGIPAEKIMVKANCVDPDPGQGAGQGGYVIFVGRLSEEKGLPCLLEAWRKSPDLPRLKIVGGGPSASLVQAAAESDPRIEQVGPLSQPEVMKLVGDASLLVCPSIWYETFGRVIIEAYATGTPVVASDLGAMSELIEDGITGHRFVAGDADDLAAKVRMLLDRNDLQTTLRRAARAKYEQTYTPQHNYQRLIEIYEAAIDSRATAGVNRESSTKRGIPEESPL